MAAWSMQKLPWRVLKLPQLNRSTTVTVAVTAVAASQRNEVYEMRTRK